MDAESLRRLRNSRWSRDPVIAPSGAAIAVCPTERDVEIFRLLDRFRYLPSDYIHAFVGGSEKALSHRLNLLSRKPNLYLSRPQQQRQCADANYRRLIYQLDERGSRFLRERGFPASIRGYHRNFPHELLVAQITASIELGVRESTNIRLITWGEIAARESTTLSTRRSERPNAIPVSYSLRGEHRSEYVVADARPFGLERVIDSRRSYLFFPGIEADCGTEPIDARDADRSSIAKKFAAYMAIAHRGIHRSHFGFPNFFVPFVTNGAARMDSMMQALDRLTNGQGSKIILFKHVPGFASSEKPLPAGGHMLSLPWRRVGFPSLSFDR